jgi:hypothetical protein
MPPQRGLRDLGDNGPSDGADGRLVGEGPDSHKDYLNPYCGGGVETTCDANGEETDCESDGACVLKLGKVLNHDEMKKVLAIECSATPTIPLHEDPANHVAEEHHKGETHSDVERSINTKTAELQEICHVSRMSADTSTRIG